MNKSILIFLITITPILNCIAQENNFYKTIREQSSIHSLDTAEGSYEKHIKRMFRVWGPRLYPHGDFAKAANAQYNYLENYNVRNSEMNLKSAVAVTGTFDPNWHCIGPTGTPSGSSGGGNGTGQIHALAFDPNYNGTTNQVVYAGTPFGGLWRSTNNGASWTNLNTGDLPHESVSDIAINPFDGNDIFITTGNGDYGFPHYEASRGQVNPIWTDGVYRSTNYGQTWSPINSGLLQDFADGGSIRRIIIHPTVSSIVYIATSEGVYRTSNALAPTPTWTKIWTPVNDDQLKGLEFKPDDPSVLIASGNDIYTNASGSWQSMTGSGTGLDLNSLPNDFEIQRINIAVSEDEPDYIFSYLVGEETIIRAPGDTTKPIVAYIYRYDGNSWSQIKYDNSTSRSETKTLTRMAIAANPEDADEVYYGTTLLYGSNNATSTSVTFNARCSYNGTNVHADVHAIEFPPVTSPDLLFVGHDGGISTKDLSNTGTGGWAMINNGLQISKIWSFDDYNFDKNIIATGNQDVGTHLMTDLTSQNWSWEAGGDGYGVQIPDFDNNYMYYSLNGKLKRYDFSNDQHTYEVSYNSDGSINWSYGPIDVPDIPSSPSTYSSLTNTFKIVNYPQGERRMYWTFGDIFERLKDVPDPSSDLNTGLNWTPISNLKLDEPAAWRRQIVEFAISDYNPDYQYIVTSGNDQWLPNPIYQLDSKLYRTTTGGCNGNYSTLCYENITANLPNYSSPGNATKPIITGIAIHPTNPSKIWLSFTGYQDNLKVWYSENAGNTWNNADPNGKLDNLPVNNIVYQDGTNERLYIATDAGVWTKDASTDWEEFGNMPNVRVTELKINYCAHKLRAATFGRSVWEADLYPSGGPSNIYEVTSNQSWDDKNFIKNIELNNGVSVTVNGDVLVAPKSTIIINRNASLTINSNGSIKTCKECADIKFIVEGDLEINNIQNSLLYNYGFEVTQYGSVNIIGDGLCSERIVNLSVETGGSFLINGVPYNDLEDYIQLSGNISGSYDAFGTIETSGTTTVAGATIIKSGYGIKLNSNFTANANLELNTLSDFNDCLDIGCPSSEEASQFLKSSGIREVHYVGNNDHLLYNKNQNEIKDQLTSQNKFNTIIYPSPFKGNFKVSFNDNWEGNVRSIEIFNSLGKEIVYDSSVNSVNEYNMESQLHGIYVVRVNYLDESISYKVVKMQ